jgi:hypothetical protein
MLQREQHELHNNVTCTEQEHALLGEGSVNMFPRKRVARNSTVTMGTGVFSVGSAPRLYRVDPSAVQLSEMT